MQNRNERPMCHRAEDLVSYLYGEATAEEERDFGGHMQQCDACRAEFNVFNQVHESIVNWRNEALGTIAAPAPARQDVPVISARIASSKRPLPALAALRDFFSVSPLWLRGATAVAGLLLCALLIFAASRIFRQPTTNTGTEARYTETDFQKAVDKKVAEEIAKLNQNANRGALTVHDSSGTTEPRPHVATDRIRPRPHPRTRLTREERVQLAADLGLIQGREDEMPFVLPDEPNQ